MSNNALNTEYNKALTIQSIVVVIAFGVAYLLPVGLQMIPIDTTTMALNYSSGFISRGLWGTVFSVISSLFPGETYNYGRLWLFSLIATTLLFVLIISFLRRVYVSLPGEEAFSGAKGLGFLLIYFTSGMFLFEWNFGRLDLYMVIISILSCLVFLSKKHTWILVLMSALGIMTHQGYAFMFYNIILVLIVYRILSTKDKQERRKHIVILSISLIVCISLFFWFEIISHAYNTGVYKDIEQRAASLSPDGISVHYYVLYKEVLGVDLSSQESIYRSGNIFELAVFLLISLPYSIPFGMRLNQIRKQIVGRTNRLKYFLVFVGGLTLLPDFIFKIDYGRWIYALVFYYAIVLLTLAADGDQYIIRFISCPQDRQKADYYWILTSLITIFYQPIMDISIDFITCAIKALVLG